MKIQDLINKLEEYQKLGSKLESVRLLKECTDLGLRESKDICDTTFNYHDTNNKFGKKVIEILKLRTDWKTIKSNIRKYEVNKS